MGLGNGKSFPRLGMSGGLVAVSNRDSPPDPVRHAEMEQSTRTVPKMIYKCHTPPRSLCTSICLALVAVAQILRDE